MPAHMVPLDIRFWQKVDKSAGCWLWTGAQHPAGYGHIKIAGKVEAAHRVSYEMAHGPIPDGLVIDHLCRVPACVNPDHLEAVTLVENTMRGEGYMAQQARKTHCKHGHEFTIANTYRWRSARICRACARTRSARRSVAKR